MQLKLLYKSHLFLTDRVFYNNILQNVVKMAYEVLQHSCICFLNKREFITTSLVPVYCLGYFYSYVRGLDPDQNSAEK